VANFIQNSPGADIWIVGNETNLPREWPGNVQGDANTGEAITPPLTSTVSTKSITSSNAGD
jgi:hypothetical protein